MQAISRVSLGRLKASQTGHEESGKENQNGALERRYEFTASGCFVRYIWPDWPPQLSAQLAEEIDKRHEKNPELRRVQEGSEDWMTISCGREADFESAEVIACAFNQNFDNKVSWVKSERDPRGRIAATCRVEGVADFSLQLSWRGTVITQANLLPGEHWPSMHKADQQIAIWASSRIQPILDTLKAKLQELYGDRFRGLYVFGSYASPDAGVDLGIDSDLDIALLLSDFDNRYDERARVSDIVASLSLEHDIVISLIPIRERDFKEGSTNFTRVISEYAIPVE